MDTRKKMRTLWTNVQKERENVDDDLEGVCDRDVKRVSGQRNVGREQTYKKRKCGHI